MKSATTVSLILLVGHLTAQAEVNWFKLEGLWKCESRMRIHELRFKSDGTVNIWGEEAPETSWLLDTEEVPFKLTFVTIVEGSAWEKTAWFDVVSPDAFQIREPYEEASGIFGPESWVCQRQSE